MTWFKVDDDFYAHPKVIAAGDEAIGFWVRAGSYCARHLLDGFVSFAVGAQLAGNSRRARARSRRLIQAELWIEVDGGWQFVGWSKYQPSRAEVLAEREQKRISGSLGGQARAKAIAKADGQASAVAAAPAPAQAIAKQSPDPDPDPTKDPPKPPTVGMGSDGANAGGSRIGSAYVEAISTAYAEGISGLTGAPFVYERHSERVRLTEIVDQAAPKELRGVALVAWTNQAARAYAGARADNPSFEAGFAPHKFSQWLRAGNAPAVRPPARVVTAPKREDAPVSLEEAARRATAAADALSRFDRQSDVFVKAAPVVDTSSDAKVSG